MYNILRAYQVIKRDGVYSVSIAYNVVDENGDIVKANEKDSFIAVDSELSAHIAAIEQYIMEHRLSE